MPPLKNPKHEAFAKEYSRQILDPNESPSAMKTHQKVYGSTYQNANDHAHRVAGISGVQNRMVEHLENAGLSDEILSELLDGFIKEKGNVGLGALRTALELKGYLKSNQTNVINATVNLDQDTIRDLLALRAG